MALDYLTWWLSPGLACFLFLNVLVAAIAVTSRSASTRRRQRLCRSASSMVLDRLRSFAKHPSVEFCYWISPEAEELKQVSGTAPDRQLAMPEPASTTAAIPMMSENAAEDESAAGEEKSMSSDDGNVTCALGQEGCHAQELMTSPPPPAAAPAVAVVVTAETASVAAVVRGLPKEAHTATTAAEFVKRKHLRRDHAYAVEGKAKLNARAEQFIRQFRQELQLQRLHSMLGRHAHSLSTGSGAPTKPVAQMQLL